MKRQHQIKQQVEFIRRWKENYGIHGSRCVMQHKYRVWPLVSLTSTYILLIGEWHTYTHWHRYCKTEAWTQSRQQVLKMHVRYWTQWRCVTLQPMHCSNRSLWSPIKSERSIIKNLFNHWVNNCSCWSQISCIHSLQAVMIISMLQNTQRRTN